MTPMDAKPAASPSRTLPQPRRPRLLDRIDQVPTRAERWRRRLRRLTLLSAIVVAAIVALALFILVRAYLESRWTLPETSITARIEEDLRYNITYDPSTSNILAVNYTTDEIIHLGNPQGGVEGVQARVERNQTENRHSYQIKDDRDILVANATEVLVSNRPLFDKTALVSHVEHGFLLAAEDGSRHRAFSNYDVRGKRLHAQVSTLVVPDAGGVSRLVNSLFEYSEWWGWFGDRARSGTRLVEYARTTPPSLIERLELEHQNWHAEQRMRLANPFSTTLDELEAHTRPLYWSDEGLPGPWWQLDLLPQGSTLHLYAARDRSREHVVHISWDKTGIFPWHWWNGGYRGRDTVGELFRIQIRDYWFHFQNQLAYLYFLDLDGDGRIDKDTELIGQVYYKVADAPLRERFERKDDVALTQENTQEFTRSKTFVFRVGADPSSARRDFLLCDAIEKLLPDAVNKGFGRDSHLGYIERARDDFILSEDLSAASLYSAVSPEDALGWKESVLTLLRAAQRPYADDVEAYYFEDPEFPGRSSP